MSIDTINVKELKEEFGDIDWMRSILNNYTVDAIQRMINTIMLEDNIDHILENKEFVQCPACGTGLQKKDLNIK